MADNVVQVRSKGERPLAINLKAILGEVGDGKHLNAKERELCKTLESLDVDGDGKIGIEELVRIGETRMANEKKIKSLTRMIVVIFLIACIVCGVMLGLMVAANEASKDTKPSSSGVMKTTGGDVVSTSGMEASVTLAGLPYLPDENLQSISKMKVKMPDGTSKMYGITGCDKYVKDGKDAVTLFTARGDKIVSSDGTVEVVEADGTTTVVETAATRHLLQAQNQNAATQMVSIWEQRQMCVPNCMTGMFTGTMTMAEFGACIGACSCIGNPNC